MSGKDTGVTDVALCRHGTEEGTFCVACATEKHLQAYGPLGAPVAPPDVKLEEKLRESALRQLAGDIGRKLNALAADEGFPTELAVAASNEATRALRFLSIFLGGSQTELANALGFYDEGKAP